MLGGLFGALAASSCCILPVVLFSLGVSGAWIGNFTQLCALPALSLRRRDRLPRDRLLGLSTARRDSRLRRGEACARPLPNRMVRIVLIAATLLIVAAFGFDYIAPYVLS